MKLLVSWTNNAPTALQRVYATNPVTKQRKRIADVAAGLESTEIDLNTLPNGPIEFPIVVTVTAVNGSAESNDRSAQVLFKGETALPGGFAAVMDNVIANRPAELPEPEFVGNYTPDAKFNSGFPHFMVDGLLFQNDAGVANCFDPTLMHQVPTPAKLNIATGLKNGITVLASNGSLYHIGTGFGTSEIVWKWANGQLTEVANSPIKTDLDYAYVFNGADGRIYCMGGYNCVKNGKFQYAVFDPATNEIEVVVEDSRPYIGNGAAFKGGVDYNGIIVMVDTSQRYVITIDTRDGTVHPAQLDLVTPVGAANARSVVGGNGAVYFMASNKTLTAVHVNTETGEYTHGEVLATIAEAGTPTCMGLAVTGELVVGLSTGGLILLINLQTKSYRKFTLPDSRWTTSVYRHDKGLTFITDKDAHHIDFSYQWNFDKSYEQSHVGGTNHIRSA